MMSKFIIVLILLLLTCWVAFTIFLVGENYKSLDLAQDLENSRDSLFLEKEYWETRFVQTLESDFEWQIVDQLHLKQREIKMLTLGKGLEGMLTVNRNGKIEDFDFKVVFDRNGLPFVTDLVPVKVLGR